MNTILALDLGTTMGWAMRLPNGTIRSGVQKLAGGKNHGIGRRYLNLRRWLAAAQCGAAIGAVFYEEVRGHRGTRAAQVYGGMEATLTAWCEEQGIAYTGVPVTTLKKDVAGHGRAEKEAVRVAVGMLGMPMPHDLNESDALSVLAWAVAKGG